MNILFLTTHFNAGGITSYLLTLSKQFILKGHKVYICSSGGDQVATFTDMGGIHLLLKIKTKSECDLRIYFALGKVVDFIKKYEIDVLHAQTRITQVMGHLLHQWVQIPYLSTCHGFFKLRIGRRFFPCWGQSVIAISTAVKDHLEKDFFVSSQKIALIPNGIELDKFPYIQPEEKQKNRKMLGLSQGPILGIVARLSDVKGHAFLIKAMPEILNHFPDVKLLIVGEGKTEQSLKQIVKNLDLDKHIFFYPVNNQTYKFLSVVDIFIMPSLQEGLGLSVMEAQAAGLPVIGTRVGGLPMIIEHEKTGLLVEPQNSSQLAKAAIDLLKNQDKAKKLSKTASVFIRENFSAQSMSEQTLSVYINLCKNKK